MIVLFTLYLEWSRNNQTFYLPSHWSGRIKIKFYLPSLRSGRVKISLSTLPREWSTKMKFIYPPAEVVRKVKDLFTLPKKMVHRSVRSEE